MMTLFVWSQQFNDISISSSSRTATTTVNVIYESALHVEDMRNVRCSRLIFCGFVKRFLAALAKKIVQIGAKILKTGEYIFFFSEHKVNVFATGNGDHSNALKTTTVTVP